MTFPCSQCGACCRRLRLSALYAGLDRGDGVCRYLHDNLCSIYEERPLLCRIEEGYEAFYRDIMDHDTYWQITLSYCAQFQNEEKRK